MTSTTVDRYVESLQTIYKWALRERVATDAELFTHIQEYVAMARREEGNPVSRYKVEIMRRLAMARREATDDRAIAIDTYLYAFYQAGMPMDEVVMLRFDAEEQGQLPHTALIKEKYMAPIRRYVFPLQQRQRTLKKIKEELDAEFQSALASYHVRQGNLSSDDFVVGAWISAARACGISMAEICACCRQARKYARFKDIQPAELSEEQIEAINTYCNLMDALDADRTELRAHMASLYPELIRRIYAKQEIQEACHLIECLYAFIYDRDIDECDRGPMEWRQALLEASRKAVIAYREHPRMHPLHYAALLRYYTVQSQDDTVYKEAVEEMRQLMNRQIETASEDLPDEELMRRILLRQENAGGFMTPDKEQVLAWTEVMELLIQRVKVKRLTDEQLLLWMKVLRGMEQWYIDFVVPFDHLWPEAYRELRGRKSLAHNIEVLAYQAWDELQRLEEAEAKRALIQKEKEFKDDFLQEVLPIQIDETLSV